MTNDSSALQPANRSQILEDAWFRFAKYDKNSGITQKRFVQQRKLILGLGVTATILAVLYSVLDRHLASQALPLPAWINQKQVLEEFHWLVIAVPIIVTGLAAYSVKFNMGIGWLMLRSSAEEIKKEIFRYRMQVEEYSPAKTTPVETRDVVLARKMKMISKRLMQTSVNQMDLQAYQGNLPPLDATAAGDDGFSDLEPEQYLRWRVEDQFNYYQRKAALLGKELRQFQAIIILLSSVGALLAAVKLEIWLTVSSALAVSFTGFLEFTRVETRVVSCNMTAADLYDIRVWWHSLPIATKNQQKNVETLVSSTEVILQTDNQGWLQEMREALSEIYGEKKAAGKEREKNPSVCPIPTKDEEPLTPTDENPVISTDAENQSSPPDTITPP